MHLCAILMTTIAKLNKDAMALTKTQKNNLKRRQCSKAVANKINNLMKKQNGVIQVFNSLTKTKEHGKTINQESFDHVSADVQQMITSVFRSESAQQYAERTNEETDQGENNVVDVDE